MVCWPAWDTDRTALTTNFARCRDIFVLADKRSTSSALVMLAASVSARSCDGLLAGMGYRSDGIDHKLRTLQGHLRLGRQAFDQFGLGDAGCVCLRTQL